MKIDVEEQLGVCSFGVEATITSQYSTLIYNVMLLIKKKKKKSIMSCLHQHDFTVSPDFPSTVPDLKLNASFSS